MKVNKGMRRITGAYWAEGRRERFRNLNAQEVVHKGGEETRLSVWSWVGKCSKYNHRMSHNEHGHRVGEENEARRTVHQLGHRPWSGMVGFGVMASGLWGSCGHLVSALRGVWTERTQEMAEVTGIGEGKTDKGERRM